MEYVLSIYLSIYLIYLSISKYIYICMYNNVLFNINEYSWGNTILHDFSMILPILNMVMFHSYLKLPEGISKII
jgi:hypothetical protein